MVKKIDLSILIVNWNTRDLLRDCLASIFSHWEVIKLEVIVVDNASLDGSVEMVEQEFPQVTMIPNNSNRGFVHANNQAAELATGRYLLLLNSDTRVLDDQVGSVLEYMGDHPDVGIVTGNVRNSDGTFQRPFRRAPHPFGALMRHTFRLIFGFNSYFHRRYRMEDVGDERAIEVEWVTGAYVFMRRELLEDGKVFDEDIFMYYEDTMLCHRCWKSGYRVMYVPLAPIIHYGGESANQVRAFAAYESFKSSVIYFRKTRGKIISGIYSLVVLTVWRMLASMFRLLSGLYGGGGRVKQKAQYFRDLVNLSLEGGGPKA
jgi:GT2 family glycosyltransferase